MKTVNSLSGGKTSCYMAIHYPADVEIFACVCIDNPKASPTDPAVFKYALEKLNGNFIATAEDDLTLKVMMDLEQLIGKEIVWVRGKSFDRIISENTLLPTWARRYCTVELKIRPIFNYIYPLYGKVNMNIGYRADERERILRFDSGKNKEMFFPSSCNVFGNKRQNWEYVDWRDGYFPLNRTFHFEIIKYWKLHHPEVIFPPDSNCKGCHHKPESLLKKNYDSGGTNREKLLSFSDWEKLKRKTGAKYQTFKDSKVTYEEIFQMNFTEEIDFENFTMCNSGGCTD